MRNIKIASRRLEQTVLTKQVAYFLRDKDYKDHTEVKNV